MGRVTDTPNEVLLEFFAHLPLKALIAARGVNRHWRQLVLHADILPIRRAFFDLYHTIIESPLFVPTRSWVLSRLQPFDRQAYLDALLADHPYLPEEFCIWILEWPACAAIRCAWPGLPVCTPPYVKCDEVEIISGFNMLGSIPPQVFTVQFEFGRRREFIPALCLWTTGGEYSCLILDERDGLRGQVHELSGHNMIVFKEEVWGRRVDMNFIEWLKRLWTEVEEEAQPRARRKRSFFPDTNVGFQRVAFSGRGSVEYPVVSQGGEFIPTIPLPLWRTRHDQESWDQAILETFGSDDFTELS